MKLLFLGSGPTKPVVRPGARNTRTNSSLLIETDVGNLLIDCTPQIELQVRRNYPGRREDFIEKLKAVFITHGHKDCIGGIPTLNSWLKGADKVINLYASRQTWNVIREKFSEQSLSQFNEAIARCDVPIMICGLKVVPFRVIHAEPFPTGRKFPTFAYFVTNTQSFVYAEDFEAIPKESEKYFSRADLLIIDAAINNLKRKEDGSIEATGRCIRGHNNVTQALQVVKKYGPKAAILTQLGHTFPTYRESVNLVRDYWYQIKGDCESEVHLSFDGMEVDLERELELRETSFLAMSFDGIVENAHQFFGSPGGKLHLASKIVERIPPHRIYVEPFAGAAAVFFKKPEFVSEKEVLGDLDSDIAFAYRFVKNLTEEKLRRLKQLDWTPKKEKFEELVAKQPKDDVERFYRFIYLNRYSYGTGGVPKGFAQKSPNQWIGDAFFDNLLRVKERLQNVTIRCADYRQLLEEFDSEGTFFYLDPPYPEEWPLGKGSFYKNAEKEYEELHDRLTKLKGKFILSVNNLPWIRELFSDFHIYRVVGYRTMQKGPKYEKQELLITNFELDRKPMMEALYLVKPHAELIYKGEKKLIVKKRLFKNMLNRDLYLVDNEKCYGLIRLTKAYPITREEFEKLRAKHKISDEEAKEWWGDFTKLYAYEFEFKPYKEPKPIKLPKGAQTFVKRIEFLRGFDIEFEPVELIKDLHNYDPRKATNEQLADDFRILCAWYATKRRGGKLKYSLEDIINVARLVYKEIERRKARGEMKHEWHPERMKPYARELFYIVSEGINVPKIKELISKVVVLKGSEGEAEDKILVVDTNLGLEHALRLGRDGYETYFAIVHGWAYPKTQDEICGYGFSEIKKIWDWGEGLERGANIVIFTDSGFGHLAEWLRSKGYHVIGAESRGDRLELDRAYLRQILSKLGIKAPPGKVVKGVSGVARAIRQASGKVYVKVSRVRGDVETFSASSPEEAEVMLSKGAFRVLGEDVEFIVEKALDGIEIGVDAWFNGKEFVPVVADTVEMKGSGNATKFNSLEESVWRDTLLKFEPWLKRRGYVGMFCLEGFYDGSQIYVTDATPRFPYICSYAYPRLLNNYSEFTIGLAKGEEVEPEIAAKYSVQIGVYADDPDTWRVIKYNRDDPEWIAYRRVIKKDGNIWFVPGDVVVAVGISGNNNLEQAAQLATNRAEAVETNNIYVQGREFISYLKQVLERGKDLGYEF